MAEQFYVCVEPTNQARDRRIWSGPWGSEKRAEEIRQIALAKGGSMDGDLIVRRYLYGGDMWFKRDPHLDVPPEEQAEAS